MRRLGHLAFVIALVAILAVTLPPLLRSWQTWRNLAPARTAGLDERVLFEASTAQGLRFNAANNEGWMALQGFVAAPDAARLAGLFLSVEITVEGAAGRLLHRERRYLGLRRASQVFAYGQMGERDPTPVWILPTQWVELTAWPQARAVGVRVVEAEPEIRALLWRGGIDNRLSDAQTRLRFRRLGSIAREALTASWVVPAALVDPELKRELVRYRLVRIAPLGRPGEDFIAHAVLRRAPVPRSRVYTAREGAIALSPTMRVSWENDALRDVAIDARTAGGRPMRAMLAERLPSGAMRTIARFQGRWSGRLPPGIHELRSEQSGDVDVREVASGDPLVPDGLRPRMHGVAAGRPLRYPLFALDGHVPPLRLSLRPVTPAGAAVRMVFRDARGALVGGREVDVPWEASLYDRRADRLDRAASVATRVELTPPPTARLLEVTASTPAMATAFTRVIRHRADIAAGPASRWYSFFPGIDVRSPLSQGVVVVEQPDAYAAAGGLRPVRVSTVPPLPRSGGPGRAADDRAAPRTLPRPRPRLRLRREGGDDEES